MNRVTLAIILFFSTALILYWQVQNKRNAPQSEAPVDVVRPDFVADDLRSVNFDEQGNVASRVAAAHMEHYEASEKTFFNQPVYLVYPDKGEAQWRLSANEGRLNRKSNRVVLENNVIIDAISPNEPIQSLKTSYVELDLDTMIMTSDREILIEGKDFNIKGSGLYADLNAQQVKLTSQVKGTYETK